MSQYDSEKTKTLLLAKIRKDKRLYHRLKIGRFFKYTAIGFLFLMLGYTYRYLEEVPEDTKISNNDLISLELSDGTLKSISENESTSIMDRYGNRIGLQKGNQLVYHQTVTSGKAVYNTLTVPYGKRFIVLLSDGSKAHLNAGTSLRYPEEFVRGESRQVYLRGEGYFNVAEDEVHPFVINTTDMNIEVVGTEFNVKAYPEDGDIRTVLVEGSVDLVQDDEFQNVKRRHRMQPGYMAICKKEGGDLNLAKVDTRLYTEWMDGRIIFKHTPFEEILKTLERNYSVSITNTYSELNEVRFTAAFDTETIEQILEAFSKNHPLTYTISGEKIRIEQS